MSATETSTVELVITASGDVRAIYDEQIDLTHLGKLSIRRGSHVEPTEDGRWTADLAPCGGPVLGPFAVRSEALAAEIAWLSEYWLNQAGDSPEGFQRCEPAQRRTPPGAPQSRLYHVRQIVWDTDDLDPSELGLPSVVLMQGDPQEFANLLSDYYGWCVSELEAVPIDDLISEAELGQWSELPLLSRISMTVVTETSALPALQTLRTSRRQA